MWSLFLFLLPLLLACLPANTSAFHPFLAPSTRASLSLHASKLSVPDSTVLVVGSGPLPLVAVKTAYFAGYKKVYHLLPPNVHERSAKLMFGDGYSYTTDEEGCLSPPFTSQSGFDDGSCGGKIKFLDGGDPSSTEELACVDGIVFASDNFEPAVPLEVANYLMECASDLKQVSVHSKTMNEEGYGWIVSAARKTANKDIWDRNKDDIQKLTSFTEGVKKKAAEKGAGVTVIKTGTLKGGGWGVTNLGDDAEGDEKVGPEGEESYGLSDAFYKAVQRDIVNFQMLYDCETSDVYVMKGDVGVGGGGTQVLKANSSKEEAGDSGRKGTAGALVYSLASGEAGSNQEFTIRSKEGRRGARGTAEWDAKFKSASTAIGQYAN
ncbi:hypothetical protein TrST_g7979 [Triparma strigata]|uniref:Uncharacterized protein n=1 Tax=Triparma strigata TaxID=1606541 RepID=A0A9W7AUG4_9STRA|nr:hypothetical protein TrST_g7979 [Triparma strigata]